MLYLSHEGFSFDASRGDQREAAGTSEAGSGGMDGIEDRRHAVGFGGTTSGADKRFAGSEPHDSGTIDKWCKSGRHTGSGTQTAAGACRSADIRAHRAPRARFGEDATGLRPIASRLGRADTGDSPKENLRVATEGTPSPILVASSWLQSETGRICLSAGSGQRRHRFSGAVKKNSPSLNPMKRSSFRMKPASVSILASDGVGPGEVNVSKSQLPASIGNGSTCLAGLRPSWEGKVSSAQLRVTARDSCLFSNICSVRSGVTPSISTLTAPNGTKAKKFNSFSRAIPGFISSIYLPTSQPSTNRNASGGKADTKSPVMSGSIVSTPFISNSKARSTTGQQPETNSYAS